MTEPRHLLELAAILSSVFGVDPESVCETTAAGDIEAWDSLGHLLLIMEIERQFKVKFRTKKIPQLVSIRDILEALDHR